jgi:DNA segregation ATPase FtsK/SpoIIIE-like protein
MSNQPIDGVQLTLARDFLRQRHREAGKLTGCTSYIQRKMGLGYNHAAAIMDHLEAEFITPPDKHGERFFR